MTTTNDGTIDDTIDCAFMAAENGEPDECVLCGRPRDEHADEVSE